MKLKNETDHSEEEEEEFENEDTIFDEIWKHLDDIRSKVDLINEELDVTESRMSDLQRFKELNLQSMEDIKRACQELKNKIDDAFDDAEGLSSQVMDELIDREDEQK